MNMWLMFGSLLLSGAHLLEGMPSSDEAPAAARQLIAVMACRGESSPLERLACYDNALATMNETGEKITIPNAGPAWQKAMDQEKRRTDHSTAFVVSEGTGDNPTVFITTPAIGIAPPRPVLMFSCIDNITRMQIALNAPLKAGAVTLVADSERFEAHWFLRENGYLLESSRGLAGIDEIKRLMAAKTLTVEGAGSGLPRLRFNISRLSQVIEPLRNACHW